MASDWSVIRGQIETALQAAPLSLRRVKRGISDIAGHGPSGAGKALFHEGYLIVPKLLARGDRLELTSHERNMRFEIWTGILITDDYDEGTDALIDRVEGIIQILTNCNVNVPSAVIVDTDGQTQFIEDPENPGQMVARIPMRTIYIMA